MVWHWLIHAFFWLCYGKNAHSVGGADWREEMARALVQWLLICARSDRACADFVFLVKLRKIRAAVTFWEDSGQEQKLFLTAPLLVCLAPAIAYLHWPYVLTFVEGTLLKCSFVELSLVGGDSIGALYRAIWRPGSSRISALKRWKAVKRVLCIWARRLPVFFNVCVFCFRKEIKRSALTICLL